MAFNETNDDAGTADAGAMLYGDGDFLLSGETPAAAHSTGADHARSNLDGNAMVIAIAHADGNAAADNDIHSDRNFNVNAIPYPRFHCDAYGNIVADTGADCHSHGHSVTIVHAHSRLDYETGARFDAHAAAAHANDGRFG